MGKEAVGVGVGVGVGIGGTFQIANQPPKRRLVVAVDGLEKEGKTNFALTAPGPMTYQNFDIGAEGVIEKFQTSKIIYRADYGIVITKDDNQATIMEKIGPAWETFVKDYKIALNQAKGVTKGPVVRSLVWDTGSEGWEVLRLARFGKLTQVMPHNYTALNSEYRNLLREVFDTPANMIILHKLKKEWLNDPLTGKGNKTGNYERAGYADTGFLVQVNVLCWRDKGVKPNPLDPSAGFHVTVQNCRQNPGIVGLDLEGGMATFPWLAVNVYPETSLEDWQ